MEIHLYSTDSLRLRMPPLHNQLLNPASPLRILEIVQDAVAIEQEFVHDALPVSLIGMNATQMCAYIEFCADRLLVALEQPCHFLTPNPFPWMTMISLQGKTNFFEKRVGEYAKSRVGIPPTEHVFDTDADF